MLGESGLQYKCELCKVTISGDKCKMEHEQGRVHLRNLARLNVTQPEIPPRTVADFYQQPLPQISPLDKQAPEPSADRKRDRERTDRLGFRKDHMDVAAQLREVANALERGEHGACPIVAVKIVAQHGITKQGARFRLTCDEVYVSSDDDTNSDGHSEGTKRRRK
jgi:hypothetical protein